MDTRFDSGSYLQTNFYSNQGMQYMPQPGYMTSPDMGAFRQTPGMMYNYQSNRMGVLQSAIVGYGAFGPNVLDTYAMGSNSYTTTMMARRKFTDATATLTTTLIDAAIGAAVGTVASGGNPFVGVAAGLLTPAFGSPVVDRIRTTRMIQQQSMSKVIGGPDLDTGMGSGFSTLAAGRIDRSIRRMAANDTLLNEKDYRKLFQLGMESSPVFDYSQTSDQYTAKLKQMVGNFKALMEILETANKKEVVDTMTRLIRMGATNDNIVQLASKERMAARMLGIQHSEFVNTYGQQGALSAASYGLTPYIGEMNAIGNAASLTLMQRLGLVSPSMMARNGGFSGVLQTQNNATNQLMGSDYNRALMLGAMDANGKIDYDKYRNNLKSLSYKEIAELATKNTDNIIKANKGDTAKAYQLINKSMEEFPDTIRNKLHSPVEQNDLYRDMYKKIGEIGAPEGSSDEDKVRYGIQASHPGMSASNVAALTKQLTDQAIHNQLQKQYNIEKENLQATKDRQLLQSKSWTSRAGRLFRRGVNYFGDWYSEQFNNTFPGFENALGSGQINPFSQPGLPTGTGMGGDLTGIKNSGISPEVIALITKHAKQMNISPEELASLVMKESSGNPYAKNDNSTASGMLQFTEGTWKQYMPEYSLDDRFNPELSLIALERVKKDYETRDPRLKGNFRELSVAFMLGLEGYKKFRAASKDAPAESVFSRKTIRANKWEGNTIGQIEEKIYNAYDKHKKNMQFTQSSPVAKPEIAFAPGMSFDDYQIGNAQDELSPFMYALSNVDSYKDKTVDSSLDAAYRELMQMIEENDIESEDDFQYKYNRLMLKYHLNKLDPKVRDMLGVALSKFINSSGLRGKQLRELKNVADADKHSKLQEFLSNGNKQISKDAHTKFKRIGGSNTQAMLDIANMKPGAAGLNVYGIMSYFNASPVSEGYTKNFMGNQRGLLMDKLNVPAEARTSKEAFIKWLKDHGYTDEEINKIDLEAMNSGVKAIKEGEGGYIDFTVGIKEAQKAYMESYGKAYLLKSDVLLQDQFHGLAGKDGGALSYLLKNRGELDKLLENKDLPDNIKQILLRIKDSSSPTEYLKKSVGAGVTLEGLGDLSRKGEGTEETTKKAVEAINNSANVNNKLVTVLSDLKDSVNALKGVLGANNDAPKGTIPPVPGANVYDGI